MSTEILALALIITCIILLGFVFWRRKFRSNKGSLTSNRQIYVGNFPYNTNENDLEDLFHSFGNIEDIKIVKDFTTKRSKGFGFVTYAEAKEAHNALQANGQEVHGRSIVVRIAKPRPNKP